MCVCVGAGVFVGTRLFGRVFFRGGDRLIDVLHWSGIVYATRVCNCRYRRERERRRRISDAAFDLSDVRVSVR